MIDGMKILCGIVTYNPEIELLIKDVQAILPQVDEVLVVDNASKNINNVRSIDDIRIIPNTKNFGIAKALNQIMNYADQNGFDWVLTLDQDSISDGTLVTSFVDTINGHPEEKIGALSPKIIYKGNEQLTRNDLAEGKIDWCITSGMFTSVKAWAESDKYEEDMFIDFVDMDFCFDIRKHGYEIYYVPTASILHELGNMKSITIGKYSLWIEKHNYKRKYYQIRNLIYVYHKYRMSRSKLKFEIAVEFLKVVVFEDDKARKISSMRKGKKDGLIMARNKGYL